MKMIQKYVEHIEEELEGAKEYAEKSVESKVRGDMNKANKYKEMANDELHHASIIHEFAVAEIEALRKIYTPPSFMLEKWNKAHAEYVEQAAWIKQMLNM